jgi:hypothetical protein
MTRPAVEGEIRCASRDYDPSTGDYRSAPRCENVAEFHWTFRDGSAHQVLCEHHAVSHNRLGVLTRVTPENPAVVTEWMIVEWGSEEDADQAWENLKNRSNAEGRTVMRKGVIYHPDGTTTRTRPGMSFDEWKAALAGPQGTVQPNES